MENYNQEQSQEEIQEYVNKVYDFAADLILNQGKSYEDAKRTLIEQGVDAEGAEIVISNIKEQIKDAKRLVANKELGYGALWAIGGIVLTAITGGQYLFWGAVVWGVWLILKGLYHKMT